MNYLPLLVELPQDRMQKALRFQVRPKFDLIRRKRIEITRFFAIREGVQVSAAVLLHQFAKLVFASVSLIAFAVSEPGNGTSCCRHVSHAGAECNPRTRSGLFLDSCFNQ